MIATDQPTIFNGALVVKVSSVSDGDMSFGRETSEKIIENRRAFLQKSGIDIDHTTLVRVGYEKAEHFARYKIVADQHKAEGMHAPTEFLADALVVTKPGHALFLPLADCAGVVLYDEKQHILMVSHIGRHSAEIDGAAKSVAYLQENFGTDPKNLKVWLSPAVGKATYPLHAMENKSLHEVILEQLKQANVPAKNIETSKIDTAADENYFSHSQFLAGNRAADGRYAMVAQMNAQGEPAF